MARMMSPGYAYKLSRRQWVDEVVTTAEARHAKYVGTHKIDGSTFAVFKVGRSTFAQLWHMTRPA